MPEIIISAPNSLVCVAKRADLPAIINQYFESVGNGPDTRVILTIYIDLPQSCTVILGEDDDDETDNSGVDAGSVSDDSNESVSDDESSNDSDGSDDNDEEDDSDDSDGSSESAAVAAPVAAAATHTCICGRVLSGNSTADAIVIN